MNDIRKSASALVLAAALGAGLTACAECGRRYRLADERCTPLDPDT